MITQQQGASYFGKKHIGQIQYEDFRLQTGLSMGNALYQWISSSWTGIHSRKNGAIVVADQKLEVKQRRQFQDALVTETMIPACDAASKEAGYITVKFAPEVIQYKPASGTLNATIGAKSQKTWMTSNFRFEIQGLNATKVAKIDAFSVKLKVSEDPVGEFRDYEKEPGRLEFGNLVVAIAEAGAADWTNWFDDFVVKGNNGDDKEKPALLSLLSSNLQEVLAHVHFFSVGIFRYEDAPRDAASETLKRVMAHLYYERAEFHLGPVESGPGDPVCKVCGGK